MINKIINYECSFFLKINAICLEVLCLYYIFQNVKYEKSKKEWLKYESTYQSILKTIQSHLEEILKGKLSTEECNVSLNI